MEAKSDDSTALVGCRLSDGHVVTLGIWAKPQGARGVGWIVPRTEVDERVRHVLDVWDVKALVGGPVARQGRRLDELLAGDHRRVASGLRPQPGVVGGRWRPEQAFDDVGHGFT
jgi:hypothetical protein